MPVGGGLAEGRDEFECAPKMHTGALLQGMAACARAAKRRAQATMQAGARAAAGRGQRRRQQLQQQGKHLPPAHLEEGHEAQQAQQAVARQRQLVHRVLLGGR